MIVFRLAKTLYSKDLSGAGAKKGGGRWNSKGKAMIYTATSRALSTAEIAVNTPLGIIPNDYSLIAIEIDEDVAILEIDQKKLPKDWKSFPHSNSTKIFGDTFINENKYLLMKVPSAVVQGEFNILINPHHKDITKIKIITIEPFVFDERLFIR